jgi:hypothetical protein
MLFALTHSVLLHKFLHCSQGTSTPLICHAGPQEWVWQELKSMGEMKFMFQVRLAFVF